MRKPFLFTTADVKALVLEPNETDAWIWDSDAGQHSGLGLRLRRGAAGVSKTWYVSFRLAGRDHRMPLGDISAYRLDDARVRAYEERRKAADGVDPRIERASRTAQAVASEACPTFRTFAADYLEYRRTGTGGTKPLRPATFRGREAYLLGGDYFKPFHGLRLNQIAKAAVAARIAVLEKERSPAVALAARMALLDLFKVAKKYGHVTENPVLDTPQPVNPAEVRDRVLDEVELAQVWAASCDDGDYGRITRLAILLGARREEIGGIRWSEIEGDVWTLPVARSKTKRELKLPLPPQALAIIRAIPREEGRDHLFGARSGSGFTAWSCEKRKLDARLPIAPWRFHDLRRTLVTALGDLGGVAPHVIEAIVNHAPPNSVHNKHYNSATYLAEKREALCKWADHIAPLRPVIVQAA